MSVAARLTARLARPHLPRRTVRLRMTLVYGGLFLMSGAALLAITYFLLRHAVARQFATGGNASLVPDGTSGAQPPSGAREALPFGGEGSSVRLLPSQAAAALERQKSTVLDQLLIQSGIALAVMSVIAIVLGWIVAGQILKRLRTITTAAREISATNLHQRLALDGPGDELKELGDTFDNLLSRLEASFEAQRQFVANVSHELRTPLARQRALGQVALSDPDATVESLRAAHERILVAGAQQERLIEALLTLTRGQTGVEVRHPFDLAQLTREIVDTRRSDADCRTVTIRTSISTALLTGHRSLAGRLVSNLVDNALRHNIPHGEVEVTTRTEDGHAVLTVANTGPVVPPHAVEQLFQPFQRFGTARTGHDEGLGLGLSIVQAIAAAHDATITTAAGPGGGLTITVTFPASHPPLNQPSPEFASVPRISRVG